MSALRFLKSPATPALKGKKVYLWLLLKKANELRKDPGKSIGHWFCLWFPGCCTC